MRLSRLDQLPDPGIPAVQWAYDRIHEERLTQADMLLELNARLKAVGLAPVSSSGFNRYVLKVRLDGLKRPALAAPDPADVRIRRITLALAKIEAGCADLRAALGETSKAL